MNDGLREIPLGFHLRDLWVGLHISYEQRTVQGLTSLSTLCSTFPEQ